MPCNEGTLDRVIRVVVGVALLAMTVAGPCSAWGLVGLVPLLTGLSGFCPLYLPLGLDTRAGKDGTMPGKAG